MFKIIYSNYSDRIKLNLILVVQIVVILILTNFIVSSFYGRYMLYRPYEYILSEEGVMFSPEKGIADPMYEFDREDIENICRKLTGDTKIHMSYSYRDALTVNENEGKDIVVHFLEEEMYDGLEFPLAEGTWDLSEHKDYIPCIIGPNRFGIGEGDYIKTDNGDTKYKVAGVLTAHTYEPKAGFGWGSNVKELFQSYDVNSADHLFLITGYSLASHMQEELQPNRNVFINYEKGLTKSEIIKNNSVLVNEGQALTFKTMRTDSKLYIYKDLRELFPVIIGAVIVICIGIISAVSVSTESQFKKYKVFYLCGCTKRKCLLINILTTNITLIVSVLLSVAIIVLYKNTAATAMVSMVISRYNFLISGAILILFELLIIMIPAILIGKKSVKELLYD